MIPRAFACAMVTSTDLRTSKAHILKYIFLFLGMVVLPLERSETLYLTS